MKPSRLQRILRLINILQSGRCYSNTELAKLLGVTRRTVFRDLNMLQQAGIPYYYDDAANGYKMDSSFFLPPLNLKLSEALALLLVARHTAAPGGLPLQQQAQEAAMKIESALPAHIRQQCSPVLTGTSVQLGPGARHDELGEMFTCFQQAIRKRRKVEITYISFHERKQIVTTLSPYHLHFARRAWYIIGDSSLHKQDRVFKLGRIKHFKMLTAIYLQKKPFRIDEFLGDAWSLMPERDSHNIKLLFAPMVAGNVAEVLWHRTQKLTWHDDGSLTFEVRVDGLTEISWWIMGYGDQVEVIAPAPLRRRIAKMAANMVKTYKTHN